MLTKIKTHLYIFFIGLLASGCASNPSGNRGLTSTPIDAKQVPALEGYRISKIPDSFASGAQINLSKNPQGWEIQATQDLSASSTELLIINPDSKIITLGARKSPDWNAKNFWQLCTKSAILKDPNPPIRTKSFYDFCKSDLTKIPSDAGTIIATAIAAPFGAALGMASAAYEVDDAQISTVLSSINQIELSKIIDSYRSNRIRTAELNAQQAKDRTEKYERDRPLREKAEKERLLRQQKEVADSVAQVKVVGQKICRSINAQSGPYGQYKFNVLATAFTEGANGNKIQVRIAALQRTDLTPELGNNMSEIGGDIVYKPNSVIWEDASLWRSCK